ncbi:alpha/beta hydrolase [Steroidobacter sp.]|uniref:alpha/beta hydrolase n=1 Tax=Steroidobacter sp. TaxID=1978227 RepID=UPI001A623A01|nr:alpha/beta hydrolase-fold protein [Steroidobacter sp.]MBL8271322.1 alpha/beta hydrolase [Steroidobacter sp.]
MTNRGLWKQLAASVVMLLALPAMAAPKQPSPPGYTLPSTHMWDMASDAGEIYRIFVSFPAATEAPADGFPVLYVLDGNASFAAFAEARRIQERFDIGKSIVVGVGYPTDQTYDARRLNDYPPAMLDPPPKLWRQLAKYKSGGRDTFLDFLTGKLRTEIASRYKVDLDRQSLFGHSLGGLFALHALFTRPQAFHSIVAASPSQEWNEQGVLDEEREFTARLTSGKVGKTSRLLVVVGGRDIDDDPYVGEAFTKRMELLSGYGLRTRFRRYEEEGHMTVPARAVTDTLRFVFESH